MRAVARRQKGLYYLCEPEARLGLSFRGFGVYVALYLGKASSVEMYRVNFAGSGYVLELKSTNRTLARILGILTPPLAKRLGEQLSGLLVLAILCYSVPQVGI